MKRRAAQQTANNGVRVGSRTDLSPQEIASELRVSGPTKYRERLLADKPAVVNKVRNVQADIQAEINQMKASLDGGMNRNTALIVRCGRFPVYEKSLKRQR